MILRLVTTCGTSGLDGVAIGLHRLVGQSRDVPASVRMAAKAHKVPLADTGARASFAWTISRSPDLWQDHPKYTRPASNPSNKGDARCCRGLRSLWRLKACE